MLVDVPESYLSVATGIGEGTRLWLHRYEVA